MRFSQRHCGLVLYPEGVKADDQADVATFAGIRLIVAKKGLQVDDAIDGLETRS
jgi:hypothetical protein